MNLSREEKRRARAQLMANLRELEDKQKKGEIVPQTDYISLRSEFDTLGRSTKPPGLIDADKPRTRCTTRVSIAESGLTPDIYKQLKKSKRTDNWILSEYNVSKEMLRLFKVENSLMMKDIRDPAKKRKPPKEKPKPVFEKREKIRVPKEIYELAEKNDINLNTVHNRIYNLHWDQRRAATQPVSDIYIKRQKKTGNVYKLTSSYKCVRRMPSGKYGARVQVGRVYHYGVARSSEIKAAEDADMLRVEFGGNLQLLNFGDKLKIYRRRIRQKQLKEGVGENENN